MTNKKTKMKFYKKMKSKIRMKEKIISETKKRIPKMKNKNEKGKWKQCWYLIMNIFVILMNDPPKNFP